MNDPKIITTWFNGESLLPARRLLLAYQASARALGVPLEVHHLDDGRMNGLLARSEASPALLARYAANTVKLRHWCDLLAAATQPLLLTDCDMLMLRDPRKLFDDEADWDVALTRYAEPGPIKWFNAGVVALRPGPGAQRFMADWLAINDQIAAHPKHVANWNALQTWCGINQAALGLLLAREDRLYRIHWLDCPVWNCVDACWPEAIMADIHLLHIKGKLRKACLTGRPHARGDLVRAWLRFDPGPLGSDRRAALEREGAIYG